MELSLNFIGRFIKPINELKNVGQPSALAKSERYGVTALTNPQFNFLAHLATLGDKTLGKRHCATPPPRWPTPNLLEAKIDYTSRQVGM